jgi:hypothetical protein
VYEELVRPLSGRLQPAVPGILAGGILPYKTIIRGPVKSPGPSHTPSQLDFGPFSELYQSEKTSPTKLNTRPHSSDDVYG